MIKSTLINFFSKKEITAPIRNKLMMTWSSEKIFYNQREKREKLRIKDKRKHRVYYFHCLSDPYSHLTSQVIKKLISNFDVELEIMFISEPSESFTPERDMYRKHCLRDSLEIAPWYGLDFKTKGFFSKENENISYKILNYFSDIKQNDFIDLINRVSKLLWMNDSKGLKKIISKFSNKQRLQFYKKANEITTDGDKKISNLEYYFGASFHYEGENYWGIDRLSYLEERLTELGLKKIEGKNGILKKIHKPKMDLSKLNKIKNPLVLEFFPSLNSPYTYISFNRVLKLTEVYPIELSVRPVLPMLMRDMNIPSQKGKYILSDAAREGHKHGSIIKYIYSPIGSPALKAYSLFPIIDSYGFGFKYLSQLAKASFFDGLNIGNEEYLEKLVNDFGLSWGIINKELNNNNWEKILKKNLDDMYKGNSWGVPSFKVTNSDGSNAYSQWGQDRIWLIENEIINRLSSHR